MSFILALIWWLSLICVEGKYHTPRSNPLWAPIGYSDLDSTQLRLYSTDSRHSQTANGWSRQHKTCHTPIDGEEALRRAREGWQALARARFLLVRPLATHRATALFSSARCA